MRFRSATLEYRLAARRFGTAGGIRHDGRATLLAHLGCYGHGHRSDREDEQASADEGAVLDHGDIGSSAGCADGRDDPLQSGLYLLSIVSLSVMIALSGSGRSFAAG